MDAAELTTKFSKVQLIECSGQSFIKITFEEMLERDWALEAIKEWEKLFEESPGKSYTMIWDCSEMKDYRPGARVVWQKAMSKHSARIDLIWLISESKVIKMGASLITFLTKHKINTVQSLAEVEGFEI